MGKKVVRGLMLAGCLALAGLGAAGAAGPLTLKEAENRMAGGGYLETLAGAYWAASQGPAVIPLLAQMLDKKGQYEQESAGAVGAFPFNALWALARIPDSRAVKVLENYRAATGDQVAALAIKGYRLRQFQQSARYGVMVNESALLERPESKAPVLKRLKPGQEVKLLREKVANPREQGPRGRAATYDRVELLPGGEQGFVPRSGDDFSPFI